MGKNTDDRRGFTKQKTANLIASDASAVAEDRRVSIQDLARAHGTSYGTISCILHSQLGLKGEWFLHWDNAPVHTAMVILKFLAKKRIKLLSHPPYSPDLTPADYFLFPKLKKEKGRASPCPGGVQEGVGGGPEKSQQGGVRQGLCVVVRALQIV